MPDFDDMTLYAESIEQPEEGDRIFQVTWMLHDEEPGAWLPTWVGVTVSIDSGLLHSFSQSKTGYLGPATSVISEEAAITYARELANDQFPMDQQSLVLKVDLMAKVIKAGARAQRDPVEDIHSLAWYVYLEGSTMTLIDANSGEAIR